MPDDVKDGNQPSKKTPKSIDAITQFGSFFANDHHAFMARKAERLASALHVVTGFISAEEPIRRKLRQSALDVMQYATSIESLGVSGPEGFGSKCAEIGALLETAQAAGLVSSMNAKLICDEYASLAVFVRDRYSLIRGRVQDLYDAPPSLMSHTTPPKGQKDIDLYRTLQRTSNEDKGQVLDTRKKEILALFETKDRISIKDAVIAIPGVSEKTIQRDLLSLVSDKILIKEGERRWSTYRKATNTTI